MSKDRLYHSFLEFFLEENYPIVLEEAKKNFQRDLEGIDDVVKYFSSYHQSINGDVFKLRSKGLNRVYKKKLIASIIYLYQPSKILSTERLNDQLAKKLKHITGYDSFGLTNIVKLACDDFKIYKGFRESVKQFCNTYKLIK